jgi:hypothetical protein
MTDVPTLTSATAANYATLNPLNKALSAGNGFSNGNLTYSQGAETDGQAVATIVPTTGKWYCELVYPTATGYPVIGVHRGGDVGLWYNIGIAYRGNSGDKIIDSSSSAYGAAFGVNDVMGIALNLDAGTVTFYKNNTSQGAITLPSSTTGWSPYLGWSYNLGNGTVGHINFGQRPFAYTPPTGFVALNTFNLPTPTIGATASTQANKYFDAKLYTGTGSSLSVTGYGFSPDFVWIKERSGAADHALYDAVRGVQKQLESNTTTAETTETTGLTALNSDGFTVGALAQVNTNTDTYVAWAWDANGAGSSNTDGTITSTVSANTSAGFSVVTYTGTLSSAGTATVGHGLGVAPQVIISKGRNQAANWAVHHTSLSTSNKYLRLNTTDAEADGAIYGSISNPSSTVFTTNYVTGYNESGINYVAYCFAEVAGYSAFGSYTGNGSTDGPFVYTGFRPKYILVKRTDSGAYQWAIWDSSRNTYNAAGTNLWTDSSEAEATSTSYEIDMLSNGFKLRTTSTSRNGSGGTHIYAAFAESPFKYANAR